MSNPLPKLYAPVTIKFWSLRNGVGEGLGVIFDIDTQVERKAMRVATKEGWKWQIIHHPKEFEWDGSLDTDIEILREYGSGIDAEVVTHRQKVKV